MLIRRWEMSSAIAPRLLFVPDPVGYSLGGRHRRSRSSAAALDDEVVHRNHTGPRQLELPPNSPVADSAGSYPTVKSCPARFTRVRVVPVGLGQRTDPVRRKEFVRVEHTDEDAHELIESDRAEQALLLTLRIRRAARASAYWGSWSGTSEAAQPPQAAGPAHRDRSWCGQRDRPTIERTFSRDLLAVGWRITS